MEILQLALIAWETLGALIFGGRIVKEKIFDKPPAIERPIDWSSQSVEVHGRDTE